MNEVYILVIAKEIEDERPEVSVTVYGNMTDALKAYGVSVDEARADSEDYEFPYEESEIATETHRYFRIEDLYSNNATTISIETMDIIGDESDDI